MEKGAWKLETRMSVKDREIISLHLSQVLADIGVNKQMVEKRQNMTSQDETMLTIAVKQHRSRCYIFNSVADGTTTMGLKSKEHILWCPDNYKVIQSKSEWDDKAFNMLMLQQEAPPGYCCLQKMGHNKFSYESMTFFKSMVLLKSNKDNLLHSQKPSTGDLFPEIPNKELGNSIEELVGYKFESWPKSALDWFKEENEMNKSDWPTAAMKNHCKTTTCFAVPIASKNSENPDYEWRFSMQEAERYLIRTLNITQIRCYVLMKMLLQSYVNPNTENFITNYICKTVLFHCVQDMTIDFWIENNLLSCIQFCLEKLVNLVKSGNCPHFFIRENNLLASLSQETKQNLLLRMETFTTFDKLSNVLCKLLIVPIDNLEIRLEMKLTNGQAGIKNIPSEEQIEKEISRQLLVNFVWKMYTLHQRLLEVIEPTLLFHYLSRFLSHSVNAGENRIQQILANQTAAFLCTTIASAIASANIRANQTISKEAMFWFSIGMNSDGLSSKLKLASTTYCAGDVKGAQSILYNSKINSNPNNQMCVCYEGIVGQYFQITFNEGDFDIQNLPATCVKFLPYERYCVPREMVYEMYRSTAKEKKLQRGSEYKWLDWAVINPLIYDKFLKYKVSRDLKQDNEVIASLITFLYLVNHPWYSGHHEIALNLLGQCLEQEGQEVDAISCYLESLAVQATYNAAKWHICKLLAKLVKRRASAINVWGISLLDERKAITEEFKEHKTQGKAGLKILKKFHAYKIF